MTKYEIAKELTIVAINNKFIIDGINEKDTYIHMNEQVAENVAAFFNKLVEKLNTTE